MTPSSTSAYYHHQPHSSINMRESLRSHSSHSPQHSSPLVELDPPPAFGLVEPGVYRCGLFTSKSFPMVSQLGIRSVIWLSIEAIPRTLREWLEQDKHAIIYNIGLPRWRCSASWLPFSHDVVKDSLEKVLNVSCHPTLLMCASGLHENGAVVGCLRRLQHWTLSATLDEYERYAGDRAQYAVQQAIELFDIDCVSLPPIHTQPAWFTTQEAAWRQDHKIKKLLQIRKHANTTANNNSNKEKHSPNQGDNNIMITPNQPPGGAGGGGGGGGGRIEDDDDIEWEYYVTDNCRLISDNVTFDEKKSIIVIDDED